MYSPAFPCIPLYSPVFPCIPLYFPCIPLYSYVFPCVTSQMFNRETERSQKCDLDTENHTFPSPSHKRAICLSGRNFESHRSEGLVYKFGEFLTVGAEKREV